SRSSSLLNRPSVVPVGPRTRRGSLRASNVLENEEYAATTSHSPRGSSSLSNPKSLPALSEEPVPAYHHEELSVASTSQEPPTSPMRVVPAASPPPKLVPPPVIKFESTAVPWKGLPLEAALWTVDSQELRNIVSRAIRSSASESFIRLLTVENLDTVLPAELERLDHLKATTQSKYRFLVHRRTMLFRALNSASSTQQKDGEDGVSVVSKLTAQLADTVAECELQLEEVLKIVDQVAQINKLIDLHWASALAIALRKLNGSYARRINDLAVAKERISQLEAELEDAWKEAEKMAGDLDDYEAAITSDDAEAVIETAEIVPVPKSPTHTRRSSMPMTPTLLAFTPLSQTPPMSTTPKTPLSPALPSSSSSQLLFPPEIHLKEKQGEAEPDVPDTVSIRSTHSTRSAKSTRSHRSGWTGESNHVSSVHAAKKRSYRASQSSLRLNIGHMRKNSSGLTRSPHDDHPPVPELPLQFSAFNNNIMSASSANASSTLLNPENGSPVPPLRRQASLDSVLTNGNVGRPFMSTANAYRGRAADDLYVRLKTYNSSTSEIQLVPRTPPPRHVTFASTHQNSEIPPPPPRKDPSKSIPSMWMNADVVKPLPPQPTAPYSDSTSALSGSTESTIPDPRPAPRNRQTSSRHSAYEKIRGLTKRYSVSLPLFNKSQN
ncbi:hypothetical protein M413DRAFT_42835, partial [Hebeloma cylindrosporum]